MEIGRPITTLFLIVVPIAAILIYITIAWQLYRSSVKCYTNLNGSSHYVLSSLRDCVEKCWSKHGFGEDTYNDDCYLIEIFLKDPLKKAEIEGFLSSTAPTKAYFDLLEEGVEHKLKVRYNFTGPEISLIRF